MHTVCVCPATAAVLSPDRFLAFCLKQVRKVAGKSQRTRSDIVCVYAPAGRFPDVKLLLECVSHCVCWDAHRSPVVPDCYQTCLCLSLTEESDMFSDFYSQFCNPTCKSLTAFWFDIFQTKQTCRDKTDKVFMSFTLLLPISHRMPTIWHKEPQSAVIQLTKFYHPAIHPSCTSYPQSGHRGNGSRREA